MTSCRPSVPRYMHDSPCAFGTPSSDTRYGFATSTPTYTSDSFAESSLHASRVSSGASAEALPSASSLLSSPACEELSAFLHDASSTMPAPIAASAAMDRAGMIDIRTPSVIGGSFANRPVPPPAGGSRAHIRRGLLSPRYGWVTAGDSITGQPRTHDIPHHESTTFIIARDASDRRRLRHAASRVLSHASAAGALGAPTSGPSPSNSFRTM